MSTLNKRTDATNAFNGLDGGADSGSTPDDRQGHGALAVPLAGSDELLSSHHDDHGADTAPVQGPQSDAGTPWAGLPALGSSTTALRSIDGEGDLGLVFGHSEGGLKRLLSASPTTALVVALQSAAASPADRFDVGFSTAANVSGFDSATSADTAAASLDGVANYRLNASAATAPAFVGLTGTGNPFNGLSFGTDSTPSLGDLDGDGDLDLVVGELFGALRYYRNTGTATAPSYAQVTATNNPFDGINLRNLNYSAPALGDLDGDGDLDVVVGDFFGDLRYFRNTGTATAPVIAQQTGLDNPFGSFNVGSYSRPSLGDIDGDGDLDLVVGASDGTLRFYRNTGTATVPAYAEQTGTANPFNGIDVGDSSAPSLGDIDRDGDLDLVVSDQDGTLSYFLNTGAATAAVYVEQTGQANPVGGFGGGGRSSPSLGDIDGDGDLDLVVGQNRGTPQTFQNQATATPPVYVGTTPTGNPFNGFDSETFSTPSLGDIDGDGDLDLVVGQDGGSLRYYRNTGTATAPAYAEQTGGANPFNGFDVGFASTPSLDDIDGDGDLDLIVGEFGGSLIYYSNTGTATAPAYAQQIGAANPFNGFDVGLASTPSLGDIDGDGDLDLVVGAANGTLAYYRNSGTATTPVYAQQSGTANPFHGFDVGLLSTPSLGDIDGDGDLDLVVGENSGTLRYYLNTGTATAPVYAEQTGGANPFNDLSSGGYSTPSLGDIDGDGDLDLVVGRADGTVLTFINNDAPTLGQAAINLAGTNEDTTTPGDTVATLLAAAGRADVDAGALKGMAVTATTGLGQWQYSVGGTVWTPVSAVSASSALLLDDGTSVRYVPDAKNGEVATLSFRAWDQSGGTASTDGTARTADTSSNGGTTAFSSASSTASLEVTSVNDAPTTRPVVLTAIQEDSGTLQITQAMLLVNAGDVDLPAQTLTASNLQLTGRGTLTGNPNGPWAYTPAPNDDTNVSFSYSVSDGTASTAGTATLDITPVNDPPVAVDDTAVTRLNTAVSIPVLANDFDIDGGPLSVLTVALGKGSNGIVTIQTDGLSVLYTPNTGFSGFESFGYSVSDGAGGTASAIVRVLVASALGTNGNDALLGTQQVDYIVGLDGDDSIQARGGADYVDGGRGADTISGGDGADTLLGGDGPDTFVATGPELVGDQIDGGDGTDTLLIPSSMTIWPANFSFTNLEQISHNGIVVLHTGLVDLSALTLLPGSNNKILGDVANNRIIGTKGDDNISDTAGNDDLRGADGNDTIQAGVGQDTLYGGTGNDRLCGDRFTSPNDGARDTFVFDTALNAATNVDQIVGFQASSQDLIMLAPSIFGAITGGATLGLDADEFKSVNGGNAQDGNDFILFDPTTGNLFYDADGSGLGAKVLFATLVSLAGTLDATDFVAAVP